MYCCYITDVEYLEPEIGGNAAQISNFWVGGVYFPCGCECDDATTWVRLVDVLCLCEAIVLLVEYI